MFAAVLRVDVDHSVGLAAPVQADLTRHRIRLQRELTGLQGGRDEDVCGREIRIRFATAVALAAEMALRPAIERLRQNRESRWNTGNVQALGRLLHQYLVAARLRRRQENAVRSIGNVFDAAEHADEPLELLVVRLDVVIADWPVVAKAVEGLRFEVARAEAQRNATPVIGAAADHAGPPPAEFVTLCDRVWLA